MTESWVEIKMQQGRLCISVCLTQLSSWAGGGEKRITKTQSSESLAD